MVRQKVITSDIEKASKSSQRHQLKMNLSTSDGQDLGLEPINETFAGTVTLDHLTQLIQNKSQ
jgi:hypothetical protein